MPWTGAVHSHGSQDSAWRVPRARDLSLWWTRDGHVGEGVQRVGEERPLCVGAGPEPPCRPPPRPCSGGPTADKSWKIKIVPVAGHRCAARCVMTPSGIATSCRGWGGHSAHPAWRGGGRGGLGCMAGPVWYITASGQPTRVRCPETMAWPAHLDRTWAGVCEGAGTRPSWLAALGGCVAGQGCSGQTTDMDYTWRDTRAHRPQPCQARVT